MTNIETLPPGPAHLVGIGGYGMRGLARLLAASGIRVTGSDAHDGANLHALRREGIACHAGHRPDGVPPDSGVVIHSAAIPADNPELVAARERRLPCLKYAEALGRFSNGRRVLACAGTHGKSTTTAILAWLLRRAAIAAGHLVGADPAPGMPGFETNARYGDPLVIEACEYDRSFLQFRPWGAVITNVEKEHVDCFPTERELRDAFRAFVERIEPGGVLALPVDVVAKLSLERHARVRVVTFGGTDGAWRAVRVARSAGRKEIVVAGPGGATLVARLSLAGDHNVTNLIGALALAGELYGADAVAEAAAAAAEFRGLRRRGEVLFDGATVLIDDYAHHPTEIEATLRAAEERYGTARRRIAVFQPHQRQRLDALKPGFVRALRGADRVFVTPVFAAREEGAENAAASAAFAGELTGAGGRAAFCPDFARARDAVLACIEPGDVVLCLGAGDITDFAAELARTVSSREGAHG